MNVHPPKNGIYRYWSIAIRSSHPLWKKNWEIPEVLLSHGATQIIQVMDDHDLVLKQPWWLGDPQFVKKHLFMVSERNECTRNSALGSWMGFEICWILQATFMLPSGYVKIAIENGDLVRGFTHWKWLFSIAMLNYQRVSDFWMESMMIWWF